MKSVQWLGVVAATLALWAGVCLAQPEEPAAPALTPEQRTAQRAVRDAEVKAALKRSEEAQQNLVKMIRTHRDDRWRRARKDLRQNLGKAGFGDKTLQQAVLDFVEDQDRMREEVRAQAALCYEAVEDQNIDNADLQKLLENYQAAAAKAQAERDAALVQLDAKISFSTNYRLKMLLTLEGLIGNERSFSSDTLSNDLGGALDLSILFPKKPAPAEAK